MLAAAYSPLIGVGFGCLCAYGRIRNALLPCAGWCSSRNLRGNEELFDTCFERKREDKQKTMSFPFEPDKTSDVPLWVQLRQRLVYLISTGYFKPGDQLPTVRALAADISINYNTVNNAYLSLASDDYIESTRGRGAFVRDLNAEADSEYAQELNEVMDDCIVACRNMGLSLDDVQAGITRRIQRMKMAELGAGDKNQRGAARIVEVDIPGSDKKAAKL